MSEPAPGTYAHFRGARYEVLDVATHSETGERVVVYRQGYGDRALWVRPVAMFVERVQRDGYDGPRFRPVHDVAEPAASGAAGAPDDARASDALGASEATTASDATGR
ncbi:MULTISPECIES: DUF1653 domain-containing protein [unclassified Agrococcus]|uniref:DUF1653 domain-containing protein n=1 Tax=unclassified Agrococcus TaxID=2615065 RepID=UPI00360F65E7